MLLRNLLHSNLGPVQSALAVTALIYSTNDPHSVWVFNKKRSKRKAGDFKYTDAFMSSAGDEGFFSKVFPFLF